MSSSTVILPPVWLATATAPMYRRLWPDVRRPLKLLGALPGIGLVDVCREAWPAGYPVLHAHLCAYDVDQQRERDRVMGELVMSILGRIEDQRR